MKKHRPFIITVLLILAGAVAAVMINRMNPFYLSKPGNNEQNQGGNVSDATSSGGKEAAEQFHAVWVPVMSLDMSAQEDKSQQAFQKKFQEIVSTAKEMGFDALIVHVRPFGDALYQSSYYPWSHTLTGIQGQDPGYDPLADMVELAHQAGLEIHAWINPLRIRSGNTPSELAPTNPYEIWKIDNDPSNDQWTVDLGEDGIYYNPSYAEVRKLIIDGVREIVEKYDVDGVHMDDYFYPTQEASFDQAAYQEYQSQIGEGNIPLTLEQWRVQNINALVSGIYGAVKSIDQSVVFGIAPQGNMENCKNMYADIQTWGSTNGYVDYLCPQMYFTFDNPYQPYGDVAKAWRDMVTLPTVRLYAGLAVYKAGSDEYDNGLWGKADDILKREMEYAQSNGFDGAFLYSYDYLRTEQTSKEMENIEDLLT